MSQESKIKTALQNCSPDGFESFVASVWSEMGWSTEVTSSSRDHGIDIMATKSRMVDEKIVIQAKCYNSGNKVGGPEVQQYSSLHKQIPDADKVIIVTSSDFTSDAITLADQLNVNLVDGDDLADACLEYLSEEQIERFFQDSAVSRQYNGSGDNTTTESVSVDSLSQSEEDLKNICEGYFHRFIEANDTKPLSRRLVFDVSRGEDSEEDAYILKGAKHYLRIYPTDRELIHRIEETAEKYGWYVEQKNVTCRKSISPTIKDTNEEFSIIINTECSDNSIPPRRQAKIVSLLISSVYNQKLSGTELKEIGPIGRADEAPTAVIE